ncbi:MAG TPA: hypothetical protein PK384_00770 [Candidatus Latescibacteria bacterium]|nr:hypothetical protein [Candidatus Latescibacterota bacterium]
MLTKVRGRHVCNFLVLFLLLPLFMTLTISPTTSFAQAVPVVSSVQGNVSNGASIVVTGSGFGSTGPNIVVFDDFEKGTNGGATAIGNGSAQVGTWDAIGELPTRYSNTYAHSGSLSNMSNWADNGAWEGSRWIGKSLSGGATNVYFSWWLYLPVNRDTPGTNSGAGPNWKIFWLYTEPWPTDDFVSVFLTNSFPVTNGSSGYFLTGFADDWRDGRIDINSNSGSTVTAFTKGQWHRYEYYFVASSTAGSLTLWELNASQARRQLGSRSGKTVDTGGKWTTLHFPGYGRGDRNSQTYYDDIYVATGPGAMARVEIGNSSTYGTSTNLAVSTATSWSDTQVVATVRLGSFKSGQTAYLYIVDSNGNVNSSGYPVTIAGGSATSPPEAPSALTAR